MTREDLLARYNCGPVKFTGNENALYERHLIFNQVIPVASATARDKFEAVARLGGLYTDQENWSRKAILNIAASGQFSSDRTIAEYARDIWHVGPCPVDTEGGTKS